MPLRLSPILVFSYLFSCKSHCAPERVLLTILCFSRSLSTEMSDDLLCIIGVILAFSYCYGPMPLLFLLQENRYGQRQTDATVHRHWLCNRSKWLNSLARTRLVFKRESQAPLLSLSDYLALQAISSAVSVH